ncbi:hypothetical protein GCM10027162_15530 [Streptomyces incanus]
MPDRENVTGLRTGGDGAGAQVLQVRDGVQRVPEGPAPVQRRTLARVADVDAVVHVAHPPENVSIPAAMTPIVPI